MQRELRAQELQLSPYCTQQIEQLISQGVQRMVVQKSNDHPGHVMSAERNLKFLVKYLADCSQKLGTFPRLSNIDFDTALNNAPTYWPYRTSS